MPTTFSSRAFNQDASGAKKATQLGPVFITDRGKPAHVLLTYSDYQKLVGKGGNIADLLAMPGAEDVEIDFPTMRDFPKAADLS